MSTDQPKRLSLGLTSSYLKQKSGLRKVSAAGFSAAIAKDVSNENDFGNLVPKM